MLTPLNLEKLEIYFDLDKVLDAVGQLDLRCPVRVAAAKKRYRRIRDGTRKKNIMAGKGHLNWDEFKVDPKTGEMKENNLTIEYPSIEDWIDDGTNHYNAKIIR